MNQLAKVKSILFVDEIKLLKKNKDFNDSFYFSGVLILFCIDFQLLGNRMWSFDNIRKPNILP